jgi:hypothetical protein
VVDLTAETPLSLTAAARLIPPARGGKATHLSTLLRWILHGARGPAGETVRLEAARIGSRWVTTHQALQRFVERLTPVLGGSDRPDSSPRSPEQRRRASDRAAARLDKAGI